MVRKTSIKARLIAGFMVCVAISAVIGGVAFWVNTQSRAHMDELGYAADAKDFARRMQANLLQARVLEKSYLMTRDWNLVQLLEAEIEDLNTNATWLAENEIYEKNASTAREVIHLANQYEQDFLAAADAVRTKGHEDLGVIGLFRDKVHEIEDVLEQYQTVELHRDMLMVRRSEKDYLLRGTDKYVQLTAEHVSTFLATLGRTDMPADVSSHIEALMVEYLDLFNQVVTLDGQIAVATAELQQTADEMAPLFDSAVAEGDSEWTRSDAEYHAFLNRTLIVVGVVLAIGVVLGLGIGIIMSRRLSRPLVASVKVAERIATGDLTVQVPPARSTDEVGQLTASFSRMKDSLTETLGEVQRAVGQVNSGSEQVAQASLALSQGSTEQAGSLEEVTASINVISGQATKNSESAMEASTVAKSSLESATSGNLRMQELAQVMKRMTDSSDEITKVVKVIDDIAFQINLLALNANVEAARAGKYGKGFAVVAEEVRNLAVRSAEAAKETTSMVAETTRGIEAGNQAAMSTSSQLEEIVTGFAKVSELLDVIAEASREQALGIDQINAGLSQIDTVTQSNAASAEETAAASEELSSQAEQLRGLVSRFRITDGDSELVASAPDETRESFDAVKLSFTEDTSPTEETRENVILQR